MTMPIPSRLARLASRRGDEPALSEMILGFESLGDNCEFGLVQRVLGAEPHGLFRFASARIEAVTSALEDGLAPLFATDDFETVVHQDEYMFRSLHYRDFLYHTDLSPRAIEEEALRAKERRRMAFLKDKMREDLRAGEKIFVRKGDESPAAIERLHNVLRGFGPVALLWVGHANGHHRAGTLEVLGNGLYRGYVETLRSFGGHDRPLDLVSWIAICRAARRHHTRGAPPGPAPGQPARRPRPAFPVAGEWIVDPSCEATTLGWPRASATRVRLGRDLGFETPVARLAIGSGIPTGSPLVFSLWVRVPRGFGGRGLDVVTSGAVSHFQALDLARRECWQQLWASSRLAPGDTKLDVCLRVTASRGETFDISPWRLEPGTVPSALAARAWSFDSREARRTIELAAVRARIGALATVRRRRNRAPAVGDRVWQGYLRAALAFAARRRFRDVDAVLERALDAFPQDTTFMRLYAQSARNAERIMLAMTRWHAALACGYDDPITMAGFAATFRELGLIDVARDVITTGLGRFPDNAWVAAEAARVATADGRDAQALALWTKAVALEPDAGARAEHEVALSRLERLAADRAPALVTR